jgi:LuxR family maltose regulon positive regulatory protein
LEVRAAELRFDAEETSQLIADVLGERLAEQDIEMLVARMEGWAAGLYLAALSLADRDDRSAFIERFAGDDRHIVDYLGGELLDGLDEGIRVFLLQTSILEKASGPLCDAVTGRTDSTAVLAQIERANLFLVPLDDQRQWYRYHQLFAELLRHELGRSLQGSEAGLHGRAAAWLAAHGAIDEG